MVVPCPPMYLVALATIMSAPWSNGLTDPTPTVLSAIRGMPLSCAIFDITSKSGISNLGFPMDSTYIALVFSSIASSNSLGVCESTNLTVRPKSFNVFSNNSNVYLYKLSADTILSPTCVRLIIV